MIRDIKIKAALNGFIVECGCQTVVFNNVDALTGAINTYLENPDVIEKEWLTNSINSKHTQPQISGGAAQADPARQARPPLPGRG